MLNHSGISNASPWCLERSPLLFLRGNGAKRGTSHAVYRHEAFTRLNVDVEEEFDVCRAELCHITWIKVLRLLLSLHIYHSLDSHDTALFFYAVALRIYCSYEVSNDYKEWTLLSGNNGGACLNTLNETHFGALLIVSAEFNRLVAFLRHLPCLPVLDRIRETCKK